MDKTKDDMFDEVRGIFQCLSMILLYAMIFTSFFGVLFVFAYFELYNLFNFGIIILKLYIIFLIFIVVFSFFGKLFRNRANNLKKKRKLFKEEIIKEIKREINGRRK
jgi:uncharacterized membrane protein